MRSLLFNINPSWYDPLPSKANCQNVLKKIVGVIHSYQYQWHQDYAKIQDFCQVIVDDDYIKILTKQGRLFLYFVIKEDKD